jgi:bifunctional DNase/RNase
MISPREVRVMGVSEATPDNNIYLLMLEEVGGSRKLPIIIGGFEAKSILIALQKVDLKRPIIYDLMLDMMMNCNIDLLRVDIVRKSGEAYFSKLVIMNGDEELQLDSRTSDSVALAIRYNAPIYVEEEILEDVKDRVQIRHTDDAPVHMLFDEELDEALQRAIASENYERAQEIKNRIKNK